MDFEQVERFDELKEFFVAEDADIEVRELADDKAAQDTRVDPSVVVGIFVRQLDEGAAEGADILAVAMAVPAVLVVAARALPGTLPLPPFPASVPAP